MWFFDIVAGAFVGFLLALTPIPVLPYILAFILFGSVREGGWRAVPVGILIFVFGFAIALSPFFIIWAVFDKGGIVRAASCFIAMYSPYWTVPVRQWWKSYRQKSDLGSPGSEFSAENHAVQFSTVVANPETRDLGNLKINAGSDNEAQELLQDSLRNLMPLDTSVTDLWDWDIQFQEESFDLVEAAFSDEDQVLEYASCLADDFLVWIDEYGMDYNQHGWEPGEFEKWIEKECLQFMQKWRQNVKDKFNR